MSDMEQYLLSILREKYNLDKKKEEELLSDTVNNDKFRELFIELMEEEYTKKENKGWSWS